MRLPLAAARSTGLAATLAAAAMLIAMLLPGLHAWQIGPACGPAQACATTRDAAPSCCGHHHHHDDDVKSFVFRAEKAFNPAKLEDFLGAIVQVYGPKMLRYKGVLHMKGSDRKVIFQGVHQLMGSDLGPKWTPGEKKESKMVFIGIDLPRDILQQGLEQCLV